MNLLEGSIAFALALAGLATVCTVLIEVLHRVFSMRSKGLRLMLDSYVNKVLLPELSGPSAPGAAPQDHDAKELMDKLVLNPLRSRLEPSDGWWSRLVWQILKPMLEHTSVSAEDFLKNLSTTKVFKNWKNATSPEEAKILLVELADAYDRYGDAATDYFKRRAQLLSILMGIVLAVMGNIHAVTLYDTFIKNPDLAQRMEAQAAGIRQALENQAKSDTPAPQPVAANEEFKQAQAEFNKAIATLHDYQNMGLPIGWNHYPNCMGADTKDPRCDKLKAKAKPDSANAQPCLLKSLLHTATNDFLGLLLWFFVTVVTGILIGLGGPFWFDIAVRLSQVRAALTGKPAIQGQAAAETGAAASQLTERQRVIERVLDATS